MKTEQYLIELFPLNVRPEISNWINKAKSSHESWIEILNKSYPVSEEDKKIIQKELKKHGFNQLDNLPEIKKFLS